MTLERDPIMFVINNFTIFINKQRPFKFAYENCDFHLEADDIYKAHVLTFPVQRSIKLLLVFAIKTMFTSYIHKWLSHENAPFESLTSFPRTLFYFRFLSTISGLGYHLWTFSEIFNLKQQKSDDRSSRLVHFKRIVTSQICFRNIVFLSNGRQFGAIWGFKKWLKTVITRFRKILNKK